MPNNEMVRTLYENLADEVRVVEFASSYDGMSGFYHAIGTKRVIFEDGKLTLQWQESFSPPVQLRLSFEEMDHLIEQFNAYCDDYDHTVPVPEHPVINLDHVEDDLKTFQPQVREKPICRYVVERNGPGYPVLFKTDLMEHFDVWCGQDIHGKPFTSETEAVQSFTAMTDAFRYSLWDYDAFLNAYVLHEEPEF